MDELTAAQRVVRRLAYQRNRFVVSQPDFYNCRREYWRQKGRAYRRFWIDLYRGRPWLEPLLYSALITVMLSGTAWFFYCQWLAREVPEPSPVTNVDSGGQANFRSVYSAILLWVPVNYWIFNFLQFPVGKRNRGLESKSITGDRFVTTKRQETLAWILMMVLWWLCNVGCAWFYCVSLFWFVSCALLIGLLCWLSCELTGQIGRVVFTDWGWYSLGLEESRWQYWCFCIFVMLNLFLFPLSTALLDGDVRFHLGPIPFTSWLTDHVVETGQGNWQSAIWVSLTVLCLAGAYCFLKRYHGSIGFRRRLIVRKRVFKYNEYSFESAQKFAEKEKATGKELLARGLADELRKLAGRGMIRRFCSRMKTIHVVGLAVVSAFPVFLILLIHLSIGRLPAESTADFHQRIDLMWVGPVFLCGGLVHLSSSTWLQVARFSKRPISLFRWWRLHLNNAAFVVGTSYLAFLPGIAIIWLLNGMEYPWMTFAAGTLLLGLLTVSVWMICASVLAITHLWFLLPAWVRWFHGDRGGILLMLVFLAAFFSVAGIAENIELSITKSMIAAMLAALPTLALLTMAYVYVLNEKLGDD